MTQLIINGVTLPETRNNKYKCYIHEHNDDIRMCDGTLVTEVGYGYYVIDYAFDYLSDAIYRSLIAVLQSREPIDTMFLPNDNSTELQRGMFKCTKRPQPEYAFSRGGKPFWHNIAFTLEGVNPID